MQITDSTKKQETDIENINKSNEGVFITMLKQREQFLDEKMNQEYKKLKTFLLKGCQECKAILIVSSLPGEGSTSVTMRLAKELTGEHDRRVILVDANLRHPTLFMKLNIGQKDGLSDILKDVTFAKAKKMVQSTFSAESKNIAEFMKEAETAFEENVARFIKTASIKNLHVISSGIVTNEDILTAENENIMQLIRYLKREYDYVLVDGAPAHLYSDALFIAPHADGVILVVEADRTRREIISKVKNDIEDFKGKIIGVILNKQRYYIPESIYKMI